MPTQCTLYTTKYKKLKEDISEIYFYKLISIHSLRKKENGFKTRYWKPGSSV